MGESLLRINGQIHIPKNLRGPRLVTSPKILGDPSPKKWSDPTLLDLTQEFIDWCIDEQQVLREKWKIDREAEARRNREKYEMEKTHWIKLTKEREDEKQRRREQRQQARRQWQDSLRQSRQHDIIDPNDKIQRKRPATPMEVNNETSVS